MKYINTINPKGSIAVDDTILVKNYPSTAGSKMLEGFTPLFSAEAVERLEKEGYQLSGKTNVGQFGLDLVGESSYFGAVTEGDSLVGAAAAVVASGEAEASLSVDLNGAPRRAAAVSGVCFVKPTYGTVSRYGVIACACSGEQIGVTAASAKKAAEILSVIAGHDSKDGTSLPQEKYEYPLDKQVGSMKLCLIRELYDAADDSSKKKVDAYIEKLIKLGASVETVSADIVYQAKTAWQILLAAETCNNLSRFDGVKYGHRAEGYKNIDELYVKSRTEGMNFLTKATIIYGSDVLSKSKYDKCYDKSLRVRRLVSEKMKELFAKYDAVIAPVSSKTAFEKYDESEGFERVYEESLFTAPASITGMPAVVSGSVQLIADHFGESTLLSIADKVEGMEA